jgi:hypothetical protein
LRAYVTWLTLMSLDTLPYSYAGNANNDVGR